MGKHYPDFEAATGYGTGAGLCGWNCRHTFFAIFPELGAPPAWTQESLEALNARDIKYNGGRYTRYEISQMQRARERTVRKYKRRYLAEDAAGADTTASAVKLRQARQDLADFISATGGRADSAAPAWQALAGARAARQRGRRRSKSHAAFFKNSIFLIVFHSLSVKALKKSFPSFLNGSAIRLKASSTRS